MSDLLPAKIDISVLMSVYSGDNPDFLNAALNSICVKQTFLPKQIVLVCDGQLDQDLHNVIDYWESKLAGVLILVKLTENIGLAKALNIGLKYCLYELIARMDADDISLANRFEIQFNFMNVNLDIAASSTYIEEFIDDVNSPIAVRELPLSHDDLVIFAKKRSPLSHPSVIFRKSIIESVGGYPEFRNAQDYALWALLITKGYRLGNIPSVLLNMRCVDMLKKRGWKHFSNEVRILKYQRSIGFLTNIEYWRNLCGRSILRLSPYFIKRFLYRFAR